MLKQKIIFFIVGGFLGFVAGAGAMLIAFPFIFAPPVLNESVSDTTSDTQLISEIKLRDDDPGQDSGHWGRGSIKIYEKQGGDIYLELQSDFAVGPGPNFWIYLNTQHDIVDEAAFKADDSRIRIEKLKSFEGSQVYKIKASQYQKAKSITIWCETFNQFIASANI